MQVPVDPALVPQVDAVRDRTQEDHDACLQEPVDAARRPLLRSEDGREDEQKRGRAVQVVLTPQQGVGDCRGGVTQTRSRGDPPERAQRAKPAVRSGATTIEVGGYAPADVLDGHGQHGQSHTGGEEVEPPRQPEFELADARVRESDAEDQRLPRRRAHHQNSDPDELGTDPSARLAPHDPGHEP